MGSILAKSEMVKNSILPCLATCKNKLYNTINVILLHTSANLANWQLPTTDLFLPTTGQLLPTTGQLFVENPRSVDEDFTDIESSKREMNFMNEEVFDVRSKIQ